MKPTRNRVFCHGCNRSKQLFESESKALNFIKFNSQDFIEEGNKPPIRAYYCSFCMGWHVTSMPAISEQFLEGKDELLKKMSDIGRKKNPNSVSSVSDARSNIQDDIIEKYEKIRSWVEDAYKELSDNHLDVAENLITKANEHFPDLGTGDFYSKKRKTLWKRLNEVKDYIDAAIRFVENKEELERRFEEAKKYKHQMDIMYNYGMNDDALDYANKCLTALKGCDDYMKEECLQMKTICQRTIALVNKEPDDEVNLPTNTNETNSSVNNG